MLVHNKDMPHTVLIVDDHIQLRELLRVILETANNIVVAEAGNGRDALEMVKEYEPEVILLDIAMPVMDGLQVLQALRAQEWNGKIIMLTGFEEKSLHAQAQALGADSYLEKGVAVYSICDEIDRVMNT
jgi:YesN/AraC family two-component response regulator